MRADFTFRAIPLTRTALSRISLVCALALSATAQAQSLKELYDTARDYDAAYLATRAEAASAEYAAAQVHALRRPDLKAEASTSSGRTDATPTGVDEKTRNGEAALRLNQTLLNRPNDYAISQADKRIEAAGAALLFAEQDLIVRLAQTYFDVLAAQDALTTALANKKAISEQLASAKRNFEVGTATITDTREAQARFDLATAQEIAADNDLLTKRIALDQLVGRTGVTPKPLAVPVVLPPVMPADVNAWVAQADTSPPVRRAQVEYDIAQYETSRARSGHLPTVGLTASYGRVFQDGGTVAIPTGTRSTYNAKSVGLQMTVPIFSGFAVQNRIRETLLLEEKTRNDLEAARRKAAQDTRSTYFGVQSLQAQVRALEAAESSSQIALEATRTGYRVGVRVNIDVLNAQTQLFTTQRDLARARYDVLINSLKLRALAGSLTADEVTAVNAVLAK